MADFPRSLNEPQTISETLARTQVLGRGASESQTIIDSQVTGQWNVLFETIGPVLDTLTHAMSAPRTVSDEAFFPRVTDNFDIQSDIWEDEDGGGVAGTITFSGGEKIFTSATNGIIGFGHSSKHKVLITPNVRYSQDITIDDINDSVSVAFSLSTQSIVGTGPFGGSSMLINFQGGGNRIAFGDYGAGLFTDPIFTWQNGVKYTVTIEVKANGDVNFFIEGGLFTSETLIARSVKAIHAQASIVGTERFIKIHAVALTIGGTVKLDNFQMIPDQQDNLSISSGLDRQIAAEDAGHFTEGVQGYLWSLKNPLTLEKDTFDLESDLFTEDFGQHDLFFKTGLWDDEVVNGAVQLLNSSQFDTLWNNTESFTFNDVAVEGSVTTVSGEKVFSHDSNFGWAINGTVNDVSTLLVLEPGTEITLKLRMVNAVSAAWIIGISPLSTLQTSNNDVAGFFLNGNKFFAQQSSAAVIATHMYDISGDLFGSGIPQRTMPLDTNVFFKWVVLTDGRIRMFSDLSDGRGFVKQGTSNFADSINMIGSRYFHVNVHNTLGGGDLVIDDLHVVNHTKELSKTSTAWNETGMKLTDKVDASENLLFETEISTDALIDASINLQHLNQIDMETGWGFRFTSTPTPASATTIGELELIFDNVVLDTFTYIIGERYKLKFITNSDDDVEFWIQGEIDYPKFTLLHTSSDRAPVTNADDLRVSATLFSDTGNLYIHDYNNESLNDGWVDFERTNEYSVNNFVAPSFVRTTGISTKAGEKILDRRGPTIAADNGYDRFYTRRKNALTPSPGQIIEIDFLQETLGNSALLYISEFDEDSITGASKNWVGIETVGGGVFSFWDGVSSVTVTGITFQANLYYKIRFYYNDDGTVRVTILGNEHAAETDIGTSSIFGSGNWLDRPNYFFLNTATAGKFYKLKDYSLSHPGTVWDDTSLSKGKTFRKITPIGGGFVGHVNPISFPSGVDYEYEMRWTTTAPTPVGFQWLMALSKTPAFALHQFNVGAADIFLRDSSGNLFNEPAIVNVFHTYMYKTLASGEVEYYIDGVLKATSTDTPNFHSGNVHLFFGVVTPGVGDLFLMDRVTVRNGVGTVVYEDDFTTKTGDWTDVLQPAGEIREPPNAHEIVDDGFVKKFITPGDFGFDNTGSIRTELFDGVPGTVAKIDFLLHKDPDELFVNIKKAEFFFGIQDGNAALDISETVGVLVEDFLRQGPLEVSGVEKSSTSLGASQTIQKDVLYSIRVYFNDDQLGTVSFTIQGGTLIDELDLGTTTVGVSGDYRSDLLSFVIQANGMYRNREGFLKVGEGQSYDLVREVHNYIKVLPETIGPVVDASLNRTLVLQRPESDIAMAPRPSDNFDSDSLKWDNEDFSGTAGTIIFSGGEKVFTSINNNLWPLGHTSKDKYVITPGVRYSQEMTITSPTLRANVRFTISTVPAILNPHAGSAIGLVFSTPGNITIGLPGTTVPSGFTWQSGVKYTVTIEIKSNGDIHYLIQGGIYTTETLLAKREVGINSSPSVIGQTRYINTSARGLLIGDSLAIDNFVMTPDEQGNLTRNVGLGRQIAVEDAGNPTDGVQGYLWSLRKPVTIEKDTFDTEIDLFTEDFGQHDLFLSPGLWNDETVNGAISLFSDTRVDDDGTGFIYNNTIVNGTVTNTNGQTIFNHTGASAWDTHGRINDVSDPITIQAGTEIIMEVEFAATSYNLLIGITPATVLDVTQKIGFNIGGSIGGIQSGPAGSPTQNLDTSDPFTGSPGAFPLNKGILLRWVVLDDGRVKMSTDFRNGLGWVNLGLSTLAQSGSAIGWQHLQVNFHSVNTGPPDTVTVNNLIVRQLNSVQSDTQWNNSESFIWNEITTDGTVTTVAGEKVFDHTSPNSFALLGTINDSVTPLILKPGTEVTLDVKNTVSLLSLWLIGISASPSFGVNQLNVTGYFQNNGSFYGQQAALGIQANKNLHDLAGETFLAGIAARPIPTDTFITLKWVVLADGRIQLFSDIKDGKGFFKQGTTNLVDSIDHTTAQFFHINIGNTLGGGKIIVDNFHVTNTTKKLSKTAPGWNETGMKLTDSVTGSDGQIFEIEVSTDSLLDASVNLQKLDQINMETGWAFRFTSNSTTPEFPPTFEGELEILFDGVVQDTFAYTPGERYTLRWRMFEKVTHQNDPLIPFVEMSIRGFREYPTMTRLIELSENDIGLSSIAPLPDVSNLRVSATIFSDTGSLYIHDYKNINENDGWVDFERTNEIGDINFIDPARVNTTGISVKSGEKILDRRGSVTLDDDGWDKFYTRRKVALKPAVNQVIEVDFLQESLGNSSLLYISELGEDSVLDPSANLTGIETDAGGILNFWDGSSGTPTAITYQANLYYRIRFYYNDDGTVRVTIQGNEHTVETDVGTSTIPGSGNWLQRDNYFFLNTFTAGIFYKLRDYSLTHRNQTESLVSFQQTQNTGSNNHGIYLTAPIAGSTDNLYEWVFRTKSFVSSTTKTAMIVTFGVYTIAGLGAGGNPAIWKFNSSGTFSAGINGETVVPSTLYNPLINHTFGIRTKSDGNVDFEFDGVILGTSTLGNLTLHSVPVYPQVNISLIGDSIVGDGTLLLDKFEVKDVTSTTIFFDDFLSDTGAWTKVEIDGRIDFLREAPMWVDKLFQDGKGKGFLSSTNASGAGTSTFGHVNKTAIVGGIDYEYELRWINPGAGQWLFGITTNPNVAVGNFAVFNLTSSTVFLQQNAAPGTLFSEPVNNGIFHTYMFKTIASGEIEFYIDGVLKATTTNTPNLHLENVYINQRIGFIDKKGADALLIDRITVRNGVGAVILEDEFTSNTGLWIDRNSRGDLLGFVGEILLPYQSIEDTGFIKKFLTTGNFGFDNAGSFRKSTFGAVPGDVAKIDFSIHEDPDELFLNNAPVQFIIGLQDGNTLINEILNSAETVGILITDVIKNGPFDIQGIQKSQATVGAVQALQKDVVYTFRIYLNQNGTASFTIQGGALIDEVDLGSTTIGVSGDYRTDLLTFVVHANGVARFREGFLGVGQGQSFDLIHAIQDIQVDLIESITSIDDVRLFKNKTCIDLETFNGTLANWIENETDGVTETSGGFLQISRTNTASWDDLGLLRINTTEGRTGLIWELDVKFDSTNSEILFGVTQEVALDRTEEVGIFFDDDGNVKIRDKGVIIGSQAYAQDIWYTIRIFEDGAGALEGTIQGGAFGSETTIGTSTTVGFDDDTLTYRLSMNARKINLNNGADFIFVENYSLCRPFGLVTKLLTENMPLVNNRVGVSKGVFFKSPLSAVVTGNPQVRLLEVGPPDTGEIAVSERLSTGVLKTLRYVPGSDLSTPSTFDLDGIPTEPLSEGWILDDSPAGVLLRGEWTVKFIVGDTVTSGQYNAHVSLFTVTANSSGVTKALKIGITKSIAITPNFVPQQYEITWNQSEAGEHFIAADEFIYVEVFLDEIVHPALTGFSVMRLDDQAGLLFSQLAFPGVTDQPTFDRPVAAETLIFADNLNVIKGFVRNESENALVSDILSHSISLQRGVFCDPPFTVIDQQVLGQTNVLFENSVVSGQISRLVNNIRSLDENSLISDAIFASASTTRTQIETVPVQAHLSGFITRPPRPDGDDGINKRLLDPIVAERRRNINKN